MKSMQYLKNIIYPVLIANLLLLTGCSRTPPPIAKTSTEEKFIKSFNKTTNLEYPLYTTTKIVGKTFWIYIATQKELLTINTTSAIGGVMPEKIIKFMDIKCRYENSAFNLDYIFLKITPEEKAKEQDLFKRSMGGIGGTSLYQDFTDTTIEILQKAYYAIGDIISDTENMNFFAICLADIKKGIKITFVIHRLDMEQFLLQMLPSDEFYNRMILTTDGRKEIINDKYGLAVDYTDISLIDFLREQIVNHASAKISGMERYEAERLKALDNLDDIIANSVYEVATKYEFGDFIIVEIKNIITRETTILTKSKLINKFSKPASALIPQDSQI